MTIKATITVDTSAVDAIAARIASRIDNLTPALLQSAEEITTFISDRFRTETDPEGKPWAELSQSTIAKKPEAKNRILVDTGTLRNSITTAKPVTSNDNSITVGTNVTYGGYHQFGTSSIPMRAFLPSDRFTGAPMTKLRARIAKYIAQYLVKP